MQHYVPRIASFAVCHSSDPMYSRKQQSIIYNDDTAEFPKQPVVYMYSTSYGKLPDMTS